MPRKPRTFSIDFKKEVVAEYVGGDPLHRVARRHGIDPALLRVWVEKAEAGDFDSEAASAELVSAYERKIAAHGGGVAAVPLDPPDLALIREIAEGFPCLGLPPDRRRAAA